MPTHFNKNLYVKALQIIAHHTRRNIVDIIGEIFRNWEVFNIY